MGVVLKQAQCVRESNGAVIGGVAKNGKRKTKKADKIGVGVGIGVEKEIGMAFGHEKLGQRGYAVCEEPGEYRTAEIAPDTDSDCTDVP